MFITLLIKPKSAKKPRIEQSVRGFGILYILTIPIVPIMQSLHSPYSGQKKVLMVL